MYTLSKRWRRQHSVRGNRSLLSGGGAVLLVVVDVARPVIWPRGLDGQPLCLHVQLLLELGLRVMMRKDRQQRKMKEASQITGLHVTMQNDLPQRNMKEALGQSAMC